MTGASPPPASRYATWLLGVISFVESSFFPIPPDVFLIPMSLAPTGTGVFLGWRMYIASVAGGMLGYFIGRALDLVGLWLIPLYGYGDKVEAFREPYAK